MMREVKLVAILMLVIFVIGVVPFKVSASIPPDDQDPPSSNLMVKYHYEKLTDTEHTKLDVNISIYVVGGILGLSGIWTLRGKKKKYKKKSTRHRSIPF